MLLLIPPFAGNPIYSAFTKFFLSEEKPDGLMDLISNPKFEFDLDLSSRMLNYHEKNGFLQSQRNGDRGKRRFSLVNVIGFKFSLYLRDRGYSVHDIKKLNEQLYKPSQNGISEWDAIVYSGLLYLGIEEIWVKKTPNPFYNLTMGGQLEMETADKTGEYFHLSLNLRETLLDTVSEKREKRVPLLGRLVFETDKARDALRLEKMLEARFDLVCKFGEAAAENCYDYNDILVLRKLPPHVYEGIYQIIHQVNDKDWYGIKIESLPLDSNANHTYNRMTNSSEDLINAIEEEMRIIHRMNQKSSN